MLLKRIPRGLAYYLCIQVPALGMMTALNYILAIEKQTIKLPREYRRKQELNDKPVLGVMSVEPSTSVNSGINFDNDFIDTSTSIDEHVFCTHHE